MKVKICLEELSFGGNRQIMLDYTRFRNQLFFWSLERDKSFLTVHLFVHVDGTNFFAVCKIERKWKEIRFFTIQMKGKLMKNWFLFTFSVNFSYFLLRFVIISEQSVFYVFFYYNFFLYKSSHILKFCFKSIFI